MNCEFLVELSIGLSEMDTSFRLCFLQTMSSDVIAHLNQVLQNTVKFVPVHVQQ